jgi:hypothetical protein
LDIYHYDPLGFFVVVDLGCLFFWGFAGSGFCNCPIVSPKTVNRAGIATFLADQDAQWFRNMLENSPKVAQQTLGLELLPSGYD